MEIALHADGKRCVNKLRASGMVGLVPRIGITVFVVEEVRTVAHFSLVYIAIARPDVFGNEEMLVMLVLATCDVPSGDFMVVFIEIVYVYCRCSPPW